MKFQITFLGVNNLFGRVASGLLKQSPIVKRLQLYDDNSRYNREPEFSYLPSQCEVHTHQGRSQLQSALEEADIVVIGDEHESSDLGSEAIASIAWRVIEYCHAFAHISPKAVLVVAAAPMNTIFPLVSHVLREHGCFDGRRVLGATSVDTLRANTLYAAYLRLNPSNVILPVVGGTSPQTRVPVFSQAKPYHNFSEEIQNKFTSEIKRFDLCTTEEDHEPNTIERAYATVRLLHSIMAGLGDEPSISEMAMAKTSLIPEISYFSLPIDLGIGGIERTFGLPELSSLEEEMIDYAVINLNRDCMRAQDLFNMYKPYYNLMESKTRAEEAEQASLSDELRNEELYLAKSTETDTEARIRENTTESRSHIEKKIVNKKRSSREYKRKRNREKTKEKVNFPTLHCPAPPMIRNFPKRNALMLEEPSSADLGSKIINGIKSIENFLSLGNGEVKEKESSLTEINNCSISEENAKNSECLNERGVDVGTEEFNEQKILTSQKTDMLNDNLEEPAPITDTIHEKVFLVQSKIEDSDESLNEEKTPKDVLNVAGETSQILFSTLDDQLNETPSSVNNYELVKYSEMTNKNDTKWISSGKISEDSSSTKLEFNAKFDNKKNIEGNCDPLSSKYFTLVNYEPTEGQYVKKMAADKKKAEKKDYNNMMIPSPKLLQQEVKQKTQQIDSEITKEKDKKDGSSECFLQQDPLQIKLSVPGATVSTKLESNEEEDNEKYYYIKKIEPESLKSWSSQEKFKIGDDKFKASIEYVEPSKAADSYKKIVESFAKVEPIISKSGQPELEAKVNNEILSDYRIIEKSQSTLPVVKSDGRGTGSNVEEKGFTLLDVTEKKINEPVKSKISLKSPAPPEAIWLKYDSMKKSDIKNVKEDKNVDKKITESPRKSSRLQEAFKMVEDKLKRKMPPEGKFIKKTPTEDKFNRKTPTEDKFKRKTTTEYLRSIMPSAKLKYKTKMEEDTKSKEIRHFVDKVGPSSKSNQKDEMKISQQVQNKNETFGGKQVLEKLLEESGILPKSVKADRRKNERNLEDNSFNVPKLSEFQQNTNKMENKNKIPVENVKSKNTLSKSAESNFELIQKKSSVKNEGTFPRDMRDTVPRNLIKANCNLTESLKPENVGKIKIGSVKLNTNSKTENELFEEIVKNETKTQFLRETPKSHIEDASNSIDKKENESRTISKQAYSLPISETLPSTQSEATKNVSFRTANITNLKTGSVDEGKPKMADSPIAVLRKVKASTEVLVKNSENLNETSNKNTLSVGEKTNKEATISGMLHNISQQIKGGIKGPSSKNTRTALDNKNSKNTSILANFAAVSSKQEPSKSASQSTDNEKLAKLSVQKVLGDELARKETRFGTHSKRNEPMELKSTNVPHKVQVPKNLHELNNMAKKESSNKSETREQKTKMITKAKSSFMEASNSHSEIFAQSKEHLQEAKSQILARNNLKTYSSFQNEKDDSMPNINVAVERSKNVEQVQKMRNSTMPITGKSDDYQHSNRKSSQFDEKSENNLSVDSIQTDISLLTEKLKETQTIMDNLMHPIQPNVKEWKNCIMENLLVKDTTGSEESGKSKPVASFQNEETQKQNLVAHSESLNKDQSQISKEIGNVNINTALALSSSFPQKIEQIHEKNLTGGIAKKAIINWDHAKTEQVTTSSAFDKTAKPTNRTSNVQLANESPKNIHEGNTVLYKYVRELNAKMEENRAHDDSNNENDKRQFVSLSNMKPEKNKKTSITVNTLKEKIRRMQEKKRANTILERISKRIGDISVESRKTPTKYTSDSENIRPKNIDSIMQTDEYIRRAKQKLYMTKELYKNKNMPKLNYKTADEYYKNAALRNIGEKTAVRTQSNDSQRNSSPSNSFTESYFTNKIKSKKSQTLTGKYFDPSSDKSIKFPKEKFKMTNILRKVDQKSKTEEVKNIAKSENKTDVFGVKLNHTSSSQQVSPEETVKKNYSSNNMDKLLSENFKMNENSKGKEQSKLGIIQNEDMIEKVASVSESNLKKGSNQQLEVMAPDKQLMKSNETTETAKSVAECKNVDNSCSTSGQSETINITKGILARFVGNMTEARNKELSAEVKEPSLENIEQVNVPKLSEMSTKTEDNRQFENTMESRQVETIGKETYTNTAKTESAQVENYSKNTNIFVPNKLDKTEDCTKLSIPNRSEIDKRYKYLNYTVCSKNIEKNDKSKLKSDVSGEKFTNKNFHRSAKWEKNKTFKVEPSSRREKKIEIRKTIRSSTPKGQTQGNVTEGKRKDGSKQSGSSVLPFKPVNMSFKTRTRDEHYGRTVVEPRKDRIRTGDSSMDREQGVLDKLALYKHNKDKTTQRVKNVNSKFPLMKRKESSNNLMQPKQMETSDRKEEKKPSINTNYKKWSPRRLKESQAEEAKLQQTKRRDEALLSINEKYSFLPKRQKLTPDLYIEYMKSMRSQFPNSPKSTYNSYSQRFSPAPIATAKAQDQSNIKQATPQPKVTKSMPFTSLSAVQTFKESHKKSDSKAPFQTSTGDVLPKETALPLQQYKHFSHQKKSSVNINMPKGTPLFLKSSQSSQPKNDSLKSNISKMKQISNPEFPKHLKSKYLHISPEQPTEVQPSKSSSRITSADMQGPVVGMPRKTYSNLYGDGFNEKSQYMYPKTVSYQRLPRVKMSHSKGGVVKEATKKIHLLKTCDQDDSNSKPLQQTAEIVQNNVRRNDLPQYHPSFPLSKPKKYQERFVRKSQSFMKKWEQIIDMFQNVMSPDKKQRVGEPVLNIDQKCEMYENENSSNLKEAGNNSDPQSDVKSFGQFHTLNNTYDKLRNSKIVQDYNLQDNPNQAIPKKQLYSKKDPEKVVKNDFQRSPFN